jgi:hypothetical protein
MESKRLCPLNNQSGPHAAAGAKGGNTFTKIAALPSWLNLSWCIFIPTSSRNHASTAGYQNPCHITQLVRHLLGGGQPLERNKKRKGLRDFIQPLQPDS